MPICTFPVDRSRSANPATLSSLNTSHGRELQPPLSPPSPQDVDGHICRICGVNSTDQPIHCISKSTAPPSYHSVVEPVPSPRLLAIPVLHIETSRRWSGLSPPRRTLQFDAEGRPHVRFRNNAFSPLSPNTQRSLGLGIPDVPSKPDIDPMTPGTAEMGNGDRIEALGKPTDFAQRFEQKMWKYSASGNVLKRWAPEIISWLISAVCMAAIVAVLFVYQNKRIPDWPIGLTLNAYISNLSKIASAALLLPVSEALGQLKWSWFNKGDSKRMWDFEIFDNASRGAWGSFLLLVRTKGQSLAALGAVVTLFSLAMDPFFQQVVEYPDHWRLQPGFGTIPRATGYVSYQVGTQYRLDSGHEQMIVLDATMHGLANHFFFDNGTQNQPFGKGIRAEVPLSCPNSNCTWPSYETLGMCSKCTDVVEFVEFKCMNSTLDWVQYPNKDPVSGMSIFPNGTACGWWLIADNPILMTGYDVDVGTNHSGELLLMRAQPLYDIDTRDPLPGYKAKLNDTRNPLAHVVIVSGESVAHVQQNRTPIAHECLISWCVKEMLSEYSEGGYTEIVNTTFVNNTMGPNPWTVIPWWNPDGSPAGNDYFYWENITITSPSGNTYEISNWSHVLTLSIFDEVFPSTYTLVNSTDEKHAMLRYEQWVVFNPWTRNLTYNPWMFDNISTHLDHMSTAMTNLMRSSEKEIEMIYGQASDKQSFVDVRWEWLSLPLGLLGLTFLFLTATIVRSYMEKGDIGVYKTSAIATLLYGLPDEMQKKIISQNSDEKSRVNVKDTKVKWVPNIGWRFSGASLPPRLDRSRNYSPTELK